MRGILIAREIIGISYATILQSTMRATDALEASKPYSIAFSSDLVRAPTARNSLRITETPTVHRRDFAVRIDRIQTTTW